MRFYNGVSYGFSELLIGLVILGIIAFVLYRLAADAAYRAKPDNHPSVRAVRLAARVAVLERAIDAYVADASEANLARLVEARRS